MWETMVLFLASAEALLGNLSSILVWIRISDSN